MTHSDSAIERILNGTQPWPSVPPSLDSLAKELKEAQGLKIGGMPLHLGQHFDDAIESLSGYVITGDDSGGMRMWHVIQRVPTSDVGRVLGGFGAAPDGTVNYIVKNFPVAFDGVDTPEKFVQAYDELQRLSGKNCTTWVVPVANTSGGMRTDCGRYSLWFHFPGRDQGTPVTASITLALIGSSK